MRGVAPILCTPVLALVWAVPSAAQVGTGQCEHVDAGRTTINRAINVTFFGGGATFRCPGGVMVRADSAMVMGTQGRAEFIGSVRYADSTHVLTAGWARYIDDQAMVQARDSVTLVDVATGTTIRNAPEMTLYQATETRAEALIFIPRGRPDVLVVRENAAGAPPDTTWIYADQLNIHGETRFLARGNAVITRSDVVALGREAEYTSDPAELRLYGAAQLEGADYDLAGDTIVVTTDAEDRLREVVAHGSAALTGDEQDLRMEAARLTIHFVEGAVERVVAVSGAPAVAVDAEPGAADALAGVADARASVADALSEEAPDSAVVDGRASAVSSEFAALADSIDAVLVAGASDTAGAARRLDRVTAVGRAYAERLDADSARRALAPVIAKDWLRGDTIVAKFKDAEPEAGEGDRVIERITATGASAPAAALTMVRNEQPDVDPAFSYQIARQIRVFFAAGEVETIELDGLVQAVYLEPEDAARRMGGGTGRGDGG